MCQHLLRSPSKNSSTEDRTEQPSITVWIIINLFFAIGSRRNFRATLYNFADLWISYGWLVALQFCLSDKADDNLILLEMLLTCLFREAWPL